MNVEWERAARSGDAVSLEAQIAHGASLDALDRYGQTALMLAAVHGHDAAVQVLLRAGASLDVTAKFGLSAVMLAVINRHQEIARAIAGAGADLGLVGTGAPGFADRTAAQLALDSGLESLARELTAPEGEPRA